MCHVSSGHVSDARSPVQVVPCLALFDTMKYIGSDVGTVGFGGCMGMSGFLLAVGSKVQAPPIITAYDPLLDDICTRRVMAEAASPCTASSRHWALAQTYNSTCLWQCVPGLRQKAVLHPSSDMISAW